MNQGCDAENYTPKKVPQKILFFFKLKDNLGFSFTFFPSRISKPLNLFRTFDPITNSVLLPLSTVPTKDLASF